MTNTDVYPQSGLRITPGPQADLFAIATVPESAEDDLAIHATDANVYLDHDAAVALDAATLVTGGDGWAQKFALVR